MENNVEGQLKEGKKQLEGVIILCWVLAIILGLSLLSNIWSAPLEIMKTDIWKGNFGTRTVFSLFGLLAGLPFRMIYTLIAPALYAVELVGVYQRRSFAVPLGRAVLVVTMIFLFPVGTIIGAIVWKRFNHPAAKLYLNYQE
ncbi:MAG: hypothetical protein U5N58_12040 [Actinomycetota bacterium]|nr:hypothetical protein [Actinomycetota bacterium]